MTKRGEGRGVVKIMGKTCDVISERAQRWFRKIVLEMESSN